MADSSNSSETGSRIAKVIARAGLCSRREAESWITAGRVAVNGKTIRTPAFNVIESDKIAVDGNPLAQRAGTRMWLYHKPTGLVVTEKDPEGRETIFEALEKHGLPRVLTIGRLDINTEGLLLLTNDGGLKRILELPDTGWLRRYRVRAHGRIKQEQLDKLKDGMEVEGIKYGPIQAELERVQGGNVWINIALREGKNREIKNVLGALGLEVNRLIRTSYGPFQLGDLPIGAVSVVRARVLRDQLGQKLAKQAGVDFESPLPDDAPGELLAKNPNQRLRKREDASLGRAPKPRRRNEQSKPEIDGPKPRKFAPERRGNFTRPPRPPKEEAPVEKRVVHFSDGRASAEFVPQAKRRKSAEGDAPREFSGKSRRDDKPHRDDKPRGDRKFGDKPRGRGRDDKRPSRRDRDGEKSFEARGGKPGASDRNGFRKGPPKGAPRGGKSSRPRNDRPPRRGPK